ncbi:zinc-binding dehydrogenase [Bacillus tianshenii]|nr:zinc-binding dehydrogenase [Bacillus tianshenii]
MKELIENGKVKPVIDKTYKMNEIREAFNYFAEGHSQGKVILTV